MLVNKLSKLIGRTDSYIIKLVIQKKNPGNQFFTKKTTILHYRMTSTSLFQYFNEPKTEKKPVWDQSKVFFLFQLLKLRKIRGKNWGKQDWWFDVTNKIIVNNRNLADGFGILQEFRSEKFGKAS